MLDVRIVAYKKHRRPDQFNYWITGLQSVLKHHSDVRVSYVDWSQDKQMFTIGLAVPRQEAQFDPAEIGQVRALWPRGGDACLSPVVDGPLILNHTIPCAAL